MVINKYYNFYIDSFNEPKNIIENILVNKREVCFNTHSDLDIDSFITLRNPIEAIEVIEKLICGDDYAIINFITIGDLIYESDVYQFHGNLPGVSKLCFTKKSEKWIESIDSHSIDSFFESLGFLIKTYSSKFKEGKIVNIHDRSYEKRYKRKLKENAIQYFH